MISQIFGFRPGMEDFGVIVTCSPRDIQYARGCCASVRYFMGDVPIALLVDGACRVDGLVAAYGVVVIERPAVVDAGLRKKSYGWGLTKMIAFWESPFARFLLLDADTVVWGDVRRYANWESHDVVVDRHLYQVAGGNTNPYLGDFMGASGGHEERLRRVRALLHEWFFDPVAIERHLPSFAWRHHVYDYFCSGALFARRGVLGLEPYLEALDLAERFPGLFGPGEMGILNYLVFRAAEEGRLRVGQEEGLQTLACRHTADELRARFPVGTGPTSVGGEAATVLHWSGRPKPRAGRAEIHADLMSWFRLRYRRDAQGCGGKASGDRDLWWEELRATVAGGVHRALQGAQSARQRWLS